MKDTTTTTNEDITMNTYTETWPTAALNPTLWDVDAVEEDTQSLFERLQLAIAQSIKSKRVVKIKVFDIDFADSEAQLQTTCCHSEEVIIHRPRQDHIERHYVVDGLRDHDENSQFRIEIYPANDLPGI